MINTKQPDCKLDPDWMIFRSIGDELAITGSLLSQDFTSFWHFIGFSSTNRQNIFKFPTRLSSFGNTLT